MVAPVETRTAPTATPNARIQIAVATPIRAVARELALRFAATLRQPPPATLSASPIEPAAEGAAQSHTITISDIQPGLAGSRAARGFRAFMRWASRRRDIRPDLSNSVGR